jgi:ubiquinone biosynthesis monooxygenase Coq7
VPIRDYTPVDHLLLNIDQALRTLFGRPLTTGRPNPATAAPATELTPTEARHAAGLMRVNHTGEICAQALYQGQALTARKTALREQLQQAALQENDHLEWCEERLQELGSRPSLLNPIFYTGSFLIGAVNGALGDRWNLGFLAETEHQVVRHLQNHQARLPADDERSRVILEVMEADEGRHAADAKAAGGADLPEPVRWAMQAVARLMTGTTYWV